MSLPALATGTLVADIERLTAAIETASIDEVRTAHERLGVAREWAKLQEDVAEATERLVWLEAVILRRIARLGAIEVLPPAKRRAARHFAGLEDGDLSSLLNDFPGRTAVTSYNLWAKAEGIKASRRRGSEFAFGEHRVSADDDQGIRDEIRFAAEGRALDVRQAAAVLVGEYGYAFLPGLPGGAVSRVVDDFIDDYNPIPDDASPLEVTAFRKGLSAAVREAFIAAPVETTERSWEIPAFITTFSESTGEWLRTPSEYATVADARQMLDLRRGQVESAQRSLDALERVFEGRFKIGSREAGEWLRDDATALFHRESRLRKSA